MMKESCETRYEEDKDYTSGRRVLHTQELTGHTTHRALHSLVIRLMLLQQQVKE